MCPRVCVKEIETEGNGGMWVSHKCPCAPPPRIKGSFMSFTETTSKAPLVCTSITHRGHVWISSALKEL